MLYKRIIPNPQSLPYVLKGEIAYFYITFEGQLNKKAYFVFSYEDFQNKLPYKYQIEIDSQSNKESFIDCMGHFKRIRLSQESLAIANNNSNIEDMIFSVKKVDKMAEIIKQSVRHLVLSELTVFVYVKKQFVDGKYEEVKQQAKIKVGIDNLIPRQYKLSGKFKQRRFKVGCVSLLCSLRAPRGLEMCKSNKISQQMDISQDRKDHIKKKQTIEQQKRIDDEDIMKRILLHQNTEGFWKDVHLIGELFNQSIQKIIQGQKDMVAAMTYLIAKWIKKHYQQKQYSLIVKKALNYVKKEAKIFEDYPSFYDKFIS